MRLYLQKLLANVKESGRASTAASSLERDGDSIEMEMERCMRIILSQEAHTGKSDDEW